MHVPPEVCQCDTQEETETARGLCRARPPRGLPVVGQNGLSAEFYTAQQRPWPPPVPENQRGEDTKEDHASSLLRETCCASTASSNNISSDI